MSLSEGSKVPDFNLIDQNGENITLNSLSGKPAVLYFYPKDETPGCTVEACEFRDIYAEFNKLDCNIYGISPDDENSHQKFIDNHSLPFTLLCDSDKKMIQDYGAWGEKNMYGKKSMGIIRSTFLIDKDGILLKQWRNVKAKGHAEKVKEVLLNS
ncbi:thioredoxin-dependent thiol peroxidase [Chloroflexi bacterium]|jgi:peroxiredoxin Q/BCP|nr:thioredoxin-dependent thiol peroxidase [Chloroflexota bacterium]MDC0252869.1 thioredoxin-dependent thiol peroxidase [Chloroflexota bacterium]RZP14360.1 MAG: thioredoxin-dependent thiol peroxidase [Chloroflexota bacterium]|tara:strand:+ start:5560 stop:6024 length:465 start_codon:yes stop_codon:yes gene_type:complete